MRSYGMGGALTGVYGEYFSTHPYTYYSHVNVVGLFIPYPYKLSVGEEVGFDLMGRWLNANANFWATDGIAAAGYAGVVLIGVIVGAFLVFCNGTMKSEIRRLAFISFIPFIMSVSNSSFFTSLFTGGGGVLLVLLYFWQGSKLQRQAR